MNRRALAILAVFISLGGSVSAQPPNELLNRSIGRSVVERQQQADSNRVAIGTAGSTVAGPPPFPCGEMTVRSYVPSPIEQSVALQNSNALLTAILTSFGATAGSADLPLDQQILDNTVLVAKLIDAACPNGECLALQPE